MTEREENLRLDSLRLSVLSFDPSGGAHDTAEILERAEQFKKFVDGEQNGPTSSAAALDRREPVSLEITGTLHSVK